MGKGRGWDWERKADGQMQRFLKALGYLSAYDRPASVDEEIQMHADTLYHRMLDQEKAQKEAEEAGLPIPQFPPIIPKATAAVQSPAPSSLPSPVEPEAAAQTRSAVDVSERAEEGKKRDYLTPEARAELKKRMKDKPEVVRELEEKAMRAEAESDASVAKRVIALQGSAKEQRQARRAKGEATVGDTVSGWFGW